MVNKNVQEKKQMKKYFSFIIYNYCFFSINMIEKLVEFADINFNTIHYLLINFITNIYIICLTNNISLDRIKTVIDEGALIIFDYLIISREECLNTTTYKIKYNDAIHFAYQKILSKINIIVKEQGSIPNNLKPMNTNKTLGLIIDGINIIKNIFNSIFKIQFNHNVSTGLQTPSANSTATGVRQILNQPMMDLELSVSGTSPISIGDNLTILKYIDITYYQNTISSLKSNAILHANTEKVICKKIDKIHKQLSDILFYNTDILEHFIINLIPDILSCIKSSDFDNNIYSIYFGYLTEYYCKLYQNKTNTCIDLNIFVIIILLFRLHHSNLCVSQLPYTVLIDKYITILQNINYNQDCEKIFKLPLKQLTVDQLFIVDNYKYLFI